jgi:probable HAF family extracellular repeat protein
MKRRLFAVSLATCGFVNKIHAADDTGIQELAPHKPVKAPVFKILRLGPFPGGWSEANAVNESGKAAGRVGFKIEGDYRPALFIPGRIPQPIYTDGPGEATGINDRSEVVGWYRQGSFTQAFRWGHEGLRTLPSLGGGNSEADGINNRSEIVGWSEAAPGAAHAVYWRGDKLSDLGTWGGYGARAVAINARGDIVGFREVVLGGIGVRQGVRWIRGQRPRVMPTPPGYDAVVPTSINERGDVTGYMYPADDFLFGRVAFIYADNAYTLKPLANNEPTVGLCINNRRDMVGFRFDQGADPRDRAMMWLRGQTPIGLDERPEFLAAGWRALGEARAINEAGTIVGWGFYARPNGGWNTEAFMIMTLN